MKSLKLGRNIHKLTEITFIRDLKFDQSRFQIIKYL